MALSCLPWTEKFYLDFSIFYFIINLHNIIKEKASICELLVKGYPRSNRSALDGNQVIIEKGKFLAFGAASREVCRNSAQANALLCWKHAQINDLPQPKNSQLQPLWDEYVSITRHLQIARHTKRLLHGEMWANRIIYFFCILSAGLAQGNTRLLTCIF